MTQSLDHFQSLCKHSLSAYEDTSVAALAAALQASYSLVLLLFAEFLDQVPPCPLSASLKVLKRFCSFFQVFSACATSFLATALAAGGIAQEECGAGARYGLMTYGKQIEAKWLQNV
jgi:hypothetical protein